ncbi:MAG: xanthine dehydrogenase accessory protein XdhC [Rhizobiaceae bacterium]|jgi:xanthine dehydrogenase accessory factor
MVEVAGAKGSTPREQGAWMLASPGAIFGTIGGGQLEYMATDAARQTLGCGFSPLEGEMPAKRAEGVTSEGTAKEAPSTAARTPPGRFAATLPSRGREALTLSIPLGPEIGQCCGGRVEVAIRPLDAASRRRLLQATEAADDALPRIFIFGGGHVGHALAEAFALLPVRTVVVETRADAVADMPAGVETHVVPMPEELVRDAPAGSAFLILTYDHALDFLIVAEALKRVDAAYVGMIGSETKKATFRSWYLKTAGGDERSFRRLVSPIGGSAVKDKRPAVIAALAAAEVMTTLANVPAGAAAESDKVG